MLSGRKLPKTHFLLGGAHVILIGCVSFLYGVWGRMWNSIVSVLDRYVFIHSSCPLMVN